jgi:hypothetical protein
MAKHTFVFVVRFAGFASHVFSGRLAASVPKNKA